MKHTVFCIYLASVFTNLFAIALAVPKQQQHSEVYCKIASDIPELTVIRLYFIARLKRISTIVSKIAQTRNVDRVLKVLESEDAGSLTIAHPMILKMFADIKKTNSLMPVVKMWENITHYQFIDDFALIHEYTKICILIVKNSIAQALSSYTKNMEHEAVNMCDLLLTLSFKDMLEAIDIVTNPYLLNHEIHAFAHTDKPKLVHNAKKEITPQNGMLTKLSLQPKEILQRFYVTQRLSKPVELLQHLHDTHGKIHLTIYRNIEEGIIVNSSTLLKHELVVDCVEQIKQNSSLQPLFYLWDAIQEYKLIDNESFIKEFISLIISIYSNILNDAANTTPEAALSIDEVAKLYDQITQLPVPQLLDVLDVYTEQYSNVLSYLDIDAKKVQSSLHFIKQHWKRIAPIFVACAAGVYYFALWRQGPKQQSQINV